MTYIQNSRGADYRGILLIVLLLLFALVYNRRALFPRWYPDETVQARSPGDRRAEQPWNRSRADSAASLVRDGDLVLRSGGDAISGLFRRVNSRDKSYSHAGLVFFENGYPFVYHCTGTSADPYALLRRDSLSRYIGPSENLAYAVYRYGLGRRQVENLHDVAIRYFRERRHFDPRFDLATDTALYCTEFVYKAVMEATGDRKYFSLTSTSDFSFVAPDNLYNRPGIRLVCKIAYIQ